MLSTGPMCFSTSSSLFSQERPKVAVVMSGCGVYGIVVDRQTTTTPTITTTATAITLLTLLLTLLLLLFSPCGSLAKD